MNGRPSAGNGYRRPMQGWWMRDRFFMRYMLREITAVAVLVYAVVLAVGVVRLAQGEAAWNGWLGAMRSPSSILVHLVLLAAMAVHAKSWFEIMPKTLPMMIVGGERVEESTIMRTGWAVSAMVTILVIAIAWWARS